MKKPVLVLERPRRLAARLGVAVARALGWRVYVFDIAFSRYPAWLERLKVAGKLDLIVRYPKGDSHSRAIAAAQRIVDRGVGQRTIAVLGRLLGIEGVELVFKRILAEHLARQFQLLHTIRTEMAGQKVWVLSPGLAENIRLLERGGLVDTVLPVGVRLVFFGRWPAVLWRFSVNFFFCSHKVVIAFAQAWRSHPTPRKIPIAWAVSGAFNLRFSGARRFDFIVDEIRIRRDDTVFFLEYVPEGDPNVQYAEYGSSFVKTHDFGSLKYALTNNVSGPWVQAVLQALPGLVMRAWAFPYTAIAARITISCYINRHMLLTRWQPRCYVYVDQNYAAQIAANLVFRARGVQTISLTQFVGGPYQLLSPPYDERNVTWSFLNPDISVLYNDAMRESYTKHAQAVGRYEILGSVFAQMIAEVSVAANRSAVIERLGIDSGTDGVHIVAIFDTTFIDLPDFMTDLDDGTHFMDDLIDIAGKNPGWRFIFKPSKADVDYADENQPMYSCGKSPVLVQKRQKLAQLKNVDMLSISADTVDVISLCDVVVTHCFSSTAVDAAAAGKPSFWYEATGKLHGYPLARVPGMYVTGRAALHKRLTDELAGRTAAQPDGEVYRHMIEPYGDCKGLARLRTVICGD